MSPNVTHDPPRTVGGGMVDATADDAKFDPVIVMNAPGRRFGVPSAEFTIPCAPGAIVGRVSTLAGASEITLSPESVSA